MIDRYKEQILDFYKKHKRMPSYSEIMNITKLKSKGAVFKVVHKLIEIGVVAKDSQGKIIPAKIPTNLKLLGSVQAGFPSGAEEELLDSLSLDDFLIPNKNSSYLLKVKGDSMIEAGIHEGDLVIVEKTNNAKNGQIIIAEVDRAWTLKYYRVKNGRVYLEAANKNYPLIYPKNELKIAAVVKAVIRKY